MLLSIDLQEDLINLKSITVTLMLSLQPPGIPGPKFDTPPPDSLITDEDTAFS